VALWIDDDASNCESLAASTSARPFERRSTADAGG
jgi:hypothetical protein